ncbi:DUF4393 domain-containing protein [Paenibacillus chitinolyticus]|uniref:DUF4393 domain-containing protein n=1 Tax=Paenibacillus chitinolyticus TaxID=79263 RepID=UPI003633A1CB
MSEEKNNVITDLLGTVKVPTEIVKKVLEPPAEQIGKGLYNLFYLVFAPIEKAKLKKEHEINLYKAEIDKRIAAIPEDNLIEPPLDIVGPALEASKYYIEHEDIRQMFAQLIASSMNKSENSLVHTSFIEIIKQLSPLDAKILKFLHDNEHSVPIASIRYVPKNQISGQKNIFDNFFPLPDMKTTNYRTYLSSVDNLIRLGLIKVRLAYAYDDKSKYQTIKEHEIYIELNNLFENDESSPGNAVLQEGIWSFTQFGTSFLSCCFDQQS